MFDRSYLDYERFDRIPDDGYFSLTILRKNTAIRVLKDFNLPDDSTMLSEWKKSKVKLP